MELTTEQVLQQGVAAHKAGKLQEAERFYRAILQTQPMHPDANHNLGVLTVSINKTQAALPLLKTALDANPNQEQFWLSYIDALIKGKQFDNAKKVIDQGKKMGLVGEKVDALEEELKQIAQSAPSKLSEKKKRLTLKEKRKKISESKQQKKKKGKSKNPNRANPSQAEIQKFLNHYQNGQYGDAEKLAISITEQFPEHQSGWKALGVVFKKTGRISEALVAIQKSVALAPEDAEAHNDMGVTLQELGRLDEAEASYRKAVALKPDYAGAHSNLGVTLKELGRLEEAEASYRQAIGLKSDYTEAHSNLGNTLKELGRFEEAEASYRKAISLKSDFAPAHNNLAVTLKKLGRAEEAEKSYRQAIAMTPDYAEAHNNLGNLLHARGLVTKSLDCFLRAISLNPDSVSFRWDFVIGQLSKVYLTHEDIKKSLHGFEIELTKLQEFITAERLNETAKVVGRTHPYYLAYFEIDNKYLLEKYGQICCRVMKHWQEKTLIAPVNSITKRDAGGGIKIGIVSAHIHYTSVWNAFLKGVIKNLDSEKFEIHIFSLSNKVDNETDLAKTTVKYFNAGEGGLTQWAYKIRNSEIDIAFYPEIGMDQQTIQLASMRLAPVQVCSYGHPQTSGLPTMDYYISSELLETSNSDSFYTEKLIKLPGLGYYFEPPTLESSDVDFIQMGINKNSPKLLCLGAPNKFSPLYDWVLIEIIRRLGNCQLVFMHDVHGASEILERRLKARIEDAGFIFGKHVVFVPQQSRQGFSALMKSADLLLDTIGFSGLNTAMQAIGCGLPVITREGQFQRTRHASAILRTLEVEELITKTETEYIDLAEKIVLDREFRHNIKCKIKDKENYLYRNENAIRALEDFFEGVISDSLKSEVKN